MSDIQNVTEELFPDSVIESEKLVLVDFWAPWCGYCTKLVPILDEIASEMQDKIVVAKVNVEENKSLTQKYGVMSLPTMVVFKDGEVVDKLIGYMPKENIISKISAHL